jgi:hypothetical protein
VLAGRSVEVRDTGLREKITPEKEGIKMKIKLSIKTLDKKESDSKEKVREESMPGVVRKRGTRH